MFIYTLLFIYPTVSNHKNMRRALILLIIFSNITADGNAQQSIDTISRIDYLNLNGVFFKYGNYFVDSTNSTYGIVDVKQCRWYYAHTIGKQAQVNSQVIAEQDLEHNILTLNCPDRLVYCKFKNHDFADFLSVNTVNGQLKQSTELRIDGKPVKLFCAFNRRKYKLVDRCK